MVTPFLCSAADLQLIPAERVPNAHIHVAREARQHGIGVLGTVDHNGSRSLITYLQNKAGDNGFLL